MEPQISLKDLYDIYAIRPQDDGSTRHQLVGKVMYHPGVGVDILADFHGYLHHLGHALDDRAWQALRRNPYFEVVSRADMKSGHRPDLIPEAEFPSVLPSPEANGTVDAPERPPSVFEYTHSALPTPIVIEVRTGRALFNGHPLTGPEMQRILENVRGGIAQIRYKKDETGGAIAKMETVFEDLVKIDPHLVQTLGHVRAAVKAGHLNPDVLRSLSRELFVDPMVPGVGNKKAYADFASRPRQGVHIRLDGNDFKSINDVHGHEAGDHAIKSMGQALRNAMDSSVGAKHGKLFRIGGDEFHAFVPSHEHAAAFARAARAHLEKVPAIGGTHNLSVSMGFGPTPEHADAASYEAKKAKTAAGYVKGQAKTHAYSALPGHEGHIPTGPEQLPLTPPPPKEAAPEAPKAPIAPAPKASATTQPQAVAP